MRSIVSQSKAKQTTARSTIRSKTKKPSFVWSSEKRAVKSVLGKGESLPQPVCNFGLPRHYRPIEQNVDGRYRCRFFQSLHPVRRQGAPLHAKQPQRLETSGGSLLGRSLFGDRVLTYSETILLTTLPCFARVVSHQPRDEPRKLFRFHTSILCDSLCL